MDHPYAEFLHRVEKPARYVGGEHGQIVKSPAGVRARMALAFPDVYDIGMSHLGTRILYDVVNGHDDLALERVFCPWSDAEREIRDRGLTLVTLETATPIRDLDLIGFSLQFELTYTNVLTMLDLGGLPLRAADRDESHPLVLGGGPSATQSEPMAPFFDAFLIGEAEARLPELLRRLADLRDAGASRRETLIELAKLGGIYVPALYETHLDEVSGFLVVGPPTEPGVPERVTRCVVEDLADFPFPDHGPVASTEAVFDRAGIEIARGCHEGCRFCQAGMIYRPVRERDPEEIVETILGAVRRGGYDEVGLTALSTADYSCISPLVKRIMTKLREQKVSLSVASLRAYGLETDLLNEIRTVRATNLTFAPEAGTQRLRDVINKNVTDEDLEATARRIFELGWRGMKLYFMIGLPTETEEDLAGIVETGRRMKAIGCEFFKPGRISITVSISTHVPKPHTPFQWCAFDTMEEIDRKQRLLADAVRRAKLDLKTHDVRGSWLECVLGRGDRRMADVIEAAWRNGARFDSWTDLFRWDAWLDAVAEHPEAGVDRTVAALPLDGGLPWDHLDLGVERRFLEREYRRAIEARPTAPCAKPRSSRTHHRTIEDHAADRDRLVCHSCGMECDLDAMQSRRGEFLAALGAHREDATTPVTTAEPARHDPRGNAPHDFGQGEALKVRIRLDRLPPATLTGHLDWVRTLPRIIRRAGLEAWYTEGFHPKARIEFSPALSLGTSSLDEMVDVALVGSMPEEEILRRLRDAAPGGIVFHEVSRLGPESGRLNRSLRAVEFLVRIDPDQLDAAGRSPEELDAAPAALMARTEIPWTVVRRRREKEADLRPVLDDVAWIAEKEVPERLGLVREGARYLRVRIRVDVPEAHARPEEIAAAVLGLDPEIETVQMARTALLPRRE